MLYSRLLTKKMKQLDAANLNELLKDPGQIRNICIIAHVDHGKTTLADSLVASNGIISPRMAGKLRYMDSRKDEQERGITMKSSSITLNHVYNGREYLVNLIDTPGHVDFSSEVSTAIRLCDGALVVVDVVEGVCPQTQVALKQAWQESIKPTLILNKIDRLILEMKLTPLDAYIHLTQVLEQVNAIVGELFNKDVMEKTDREVECREKEELEIADWDGALEDIDDSSLYFSPDHGNVIFASAIDGWGFSLEDFIKLYSTKLGVKETVLRKTLWGDYYYNSKTKSVKKGAQIRAKKPLFVQLVLENIWAIYDAICISKDKEKVVRMVETLGVKVSTRDMRHTDPKVQLLAICNQWLPISKCVMDMVCKVLPAANQLDDDKVERLMRSNNEDFDKYPIETKQLKTAFVNCCSDENAPLIVFVSKMFAVEPKLLPQNRPQALTQEEMAKRRELAKLRLAQKQEGIKQPEELGPTLQNPEEEILPPPPPDDVFVAFARVYSGTLRKGNKVYVLGPKHDPAKARQYQEEEGDLSEDLQLKDLKAGHHATIATIGEIYLMMGRDLEAIPAAYPGNVVGIEGLGDHILKSATLSSELCCPSFSELNLMAVPILRVAIEPVKPTDLPALVKGLKLLNQADSCVQVMMQETGEHVLVTAGEVHLEHCLHDLKTRYAKVEVMVSEPIIPFRETVVPPPIIDQANEAIQQKQNVKKVTNEGADDQEIVVWTANKQSLIRIQCTPLPPKLTDLLEKSGDLLKTLDESTSSKSFCLDSFTRLSKSVEDGDSMQTSVANNTINELIKLRNDLKEALIDSDGIWKDSNIVDKIWSFGPRRCGPNVLINNIKTYEGRNVWKHTNDIKSPLLQYDGSFVNGFQLATLAGPLCEEPMMGVAFIVIDWEIVENSTASTTYGPFSGQIMSTVKEACRKSFQLQHQRLMAAMYTCNIQVNSEVLGKMYAVLGRRLGRILHGDMTQGTSTFAVQAVLPVIESFNFAQEIRKQTSGLANPQLIFSHWEVIDIDPFWLPSTEEEYLLFGEKADTENKARLYMNHIRRRKGLPVDEQIVQHAEKQRTLSRKK